MPAKPERMLVVDIDGTLLDTSMVLRPSARDALNRAASAGFHLVFATGRQYRSCRHLIRDVAPAAPAVLNSGALIKDTRTDQTLFSHTLPQDLSLQIAARIAHAGFVPILMMDGYTQGFDFLTVNAEDTTLGHANFTTRNREFGIFVPALPPDLPAPVTQVLALGDRPELSPLLEDVRSSFPDHADLRIIRAPQYDLFVFEAYARNASKWNAVRWLARSIHVPLPNVAAVGDDINDIELLRECGFGVAMESAPQHVRNVARAVAPSCDNDGFAHAVDLILSRNP